MAIAFAARAVPAWFAAAAGTLVVVAPCGDSASGYPAAAARRGWPVGTYGLLAMVLNTFEVELDPGLPAEN
ncbi:hypothetical protein ACWD24_54425, partial [Streptomyces mirabilis]